MSKKSLAVELSKLKTFKEAKAHLEQYATDSEVAADVLWNANLNGDIFGKIIADFGAGTGILGVGCMILGGGKVFFVEKDSDVISQLKDNIEHYKGNFEVINQDVVDFDIKVDTIVMNPPFGVQHRKADKKFLEKAFEISKTIYYIGKIDSANFLRSISKDHDWEITHRWDYEMGLKRTMKHHFRKMHRVKISCWRLKKE